MAIDALTSSGIESLVYSYKEAQIESQITSLSTRRTKYQNLTSKYGVLSSKLDSFKSLLTTMKSSTSSFYSTRTSTSSNTSFVSVSNTSTAALGSYSLRVSQLAKSDLLASSTINSDTASGIAEGTYKINVKVGSVNKEVEVKLGADETVKGVMEKIRDSFNSDSEVNKVMSTATFSPSTGKSKLSFSSLSTGADNKIELSDVGGGNLLQSIGITSELVTGRTKMTDTGAGYEEELSTSLNSIFKLNGIQITRNSNSISDVMDGVTFSLKATMKDTDSNVNIEVKNDSTNFKTKIQEFVSKFNDVFNYIRNNSGSSSLGVRGDFIGDPTAVAVNRALSSVVTTELTGLPEGAIKKLSDAGISYSGINGLSIDSTKLDDALSSNLNGLKDMFGGDNGLANSFLTKIDPALGRNGYISKAQSSINSTISSISTRITSTNERIEKSAELLRKQYQQMQLDLANLINMQNTFYSSYSSTGTSY